MLIFFFFNDTATTEIYTLSLHDALPILLIACMPAQSYAQEVWTGFTLRLKPLKRINVDIEQQFRFADGFSTDRKSTRLNSSHANISYAVFCLKKNNHITRVTSFYSPIPC